MVFKTSKCKTQTELEDSFGYKFVTYSDGTVAMYAPSSTNPSGFDPIPLDKDCCETLSPDYRWDIDNQACRVKKFNTLGVSCKIDEPIKINLNSRNDDGSVFYNNGDEVCRLDIEFKYLFKFTCEGLTKAFDDHEIKPSTVLENLNVFANLYKKDGTDLDTIHTDEILPSMTNSGSNLYDYLSTHNPSGFYICDIVTTGCTPFNLNSPLSNKYTLNDDCRILNELNTQMIQQSGVGQLITVEEYNAIIGPDALASNWLTYTMSITDQSVINDIINEKISVGLTVKDTMSDMCILIDDIKMERVCTETERTNIFISESPSFEMNRIVDNKKSWLSNTTNTVREFDISTNKGTNTIRQTGYDVDNERLVINSKEIDLDVNIASGVEEDVWCYSYDNPCIFDCITGTTSGSSCPAGYTTNPALDGCTKIESTGVTSGGTIFTASSVSNTAWGITGTYFYDNIDGLTYPLNYSGASGDISANILRDDNGTGTTVPLQTIVSSGANTLWMNVYPGNTDGRLNNTAVWDTTVWPGYEWIGYSYCLNIDTTGVYSLGIAGDNFVRVKINGELIIDLTSGYAFNMFRRWHVFPITLDSGINIIELEGYNDEPDGSTSAGFGAEIYDETVPNLSGMTGETQLSAVTIFSTANETGQVLPLGSFSCPTGYSLNTCNSGDTVCSKITKISMDVGPATSGCVETTSGDFGLDFNTLSPSLTAATTFEGIQHVITTELIDAKDRQTLSAYPTLRALYDRYINSTGYCGTVSSAFDYGTMEDFSNLLGDYWVDIIEQVIPATTIWGSVKIYSNTAFDQQKYQYRSYSSLFCGNPFSGNTVLSPIDGTSGLCQTVSVETIALPSGSGNTSNVPTICNSVCLAQLNYGSEFIGEVTIIEPLI